MMTAPAGIKCPSRREALVGFVVVVKRQAELFEVVFRLRPAGRFPGLLDRRQHQSQAEADDAERNAQPKPAMKNRGNRAHENRPKNSRGNFSPRPGFYIGVLRPRKR